MDWLKKIKALNLGSLTEYLPQTGLESVSWVEFVKQASTVLKTSADHKSLKKVREELRSSLLPEFVESSQGLVSLKELCALKTDENLEVRRYWGEKVLGLYFESVLAKPHLLNLDFRPDAFFVSKNLNEPRAHWALSRFIVKLETGFSLSLGLLYKGYYEQRPKDFKQALIELSLLGVEQDPMELENLLLSYFGNAGEKPVTFELKKFKTSFIELFKYLKKNKRKIPSNFMWMGLALAGVYETLELLGADYHVKEVFIRSRKS